MIQFDNEKKLTLNDKAKPILNCTLILQSAGFDSDGEFAYFVRLQGKKLTSVKVFTPHDANKHDFVQIIMGLGFVYTGSEAEVQEIFLALQSQETSNNNMLYFKNFAGRYTKRGYDLVVCRNGIYDIKNEMFFEYGEKNNATLADGTVVLVERKAEDLRLFPRYQEPDGEYKNMTVSQFFTKKLQPLWKKNPFSIMIYSWFIGTLFLEEVLKYGQEGFFPILFVAGDAGTGKTQILRIMRRIVGYNEEPVPFAVSTFIDELEMSYVHSFPIWRDEYRTDAPLLEKKHEHLRSFYNRSGMPKGRADLTSRTLPVNATIFVSGEGRPEDKAVKRRLIPFAFSTESKHTPEVYHEFLNDSLDWGQMLPIIYKRGKAVDWTQLPVKYKQYLKAFVDFDFPERFAMLSAIFDLFIGVVPQEAVIESSKKYSRVVMVEFPTGDQTEDFFEAIHLFFLKKGMYAKQFGENAMASLSYIREEPDNIYVYMAGLYPFYTEQMRSANAKDFKGIGEIRSIMKDRFKATTDSQRFEGSGNTLSCLCFPKKTCPAGILIITSTIEEAKRREIKMYEDSY